MATEITVLPNPSHKNCTVNQYVAGLQLWSINWKHLKPRDCTPTSSTVCARHQKRAPNTICSGEMQRRSVAWLKVWYPCQLPGVAHHTHVRCYLGGKVEKGYTGTLCSLLATSKIISKKSFKKYLLKREWISKSFKPAEHAIHLRHWCLRTPLGNLLYDFFLRRRVTFVTVNLKRFYCTSLPLDPFALSPDSGPQPKIFDLFQSLAISPTWGLLAQFTSWIYLFPPPLCLFPWPSKHPVSFLPS